MSSEKKVKKKGGCLKIFLIVFLVIVVLVVAVLAIGYNKLKKKVEVQLHSNTYVGMDCPDFEVTTLDGQTVKMSELLEGKEALCVVEFATWCGPCEKEFPEMDKVYQRYKDKLAMIGILVDPLDDEESGKEYVNSHNFSFPVAMGNDTLDDISSSSYPTTLIIDRNGKIGMHRVGLIPDEETFEMIVTTFMGDDYQEKQLAYYTFTAYSGIRIAAGTEFTVTSDEGTKTYTIGEKGSVDVFYDKPADMKVKVTKVPDGFFIDGDGETSTDVGSTIIRLPVK